MSAASARSPAARSSAWSSSDPHERRAHDHAVGVRRHLGGLVAVADAEADPDRQVGGGAGAGDQRAGQVAGASCGRR